VKTTTQNFNNFSDVYQAKYEISLATALTPLALPASFSKSRVIKTGLNVINCF
jgi:hypothetical protein